MKIITLFSYLFLSYALYAQGYDHKSPVQTNPFFAPTVINPEKIEITLKKDDSAISCTLESNSPYYFCTNGKSPLLVKRTDNGFIALSKDKQSLPEIIKINRVSSSGTIIHQEGEIKSFNPFSGYPNSNEITNIVQARDIASQYSQKIQDVDNFFTTFGFVKTDNPLETGSDDFKKVASKYIEEKQKLKDIVSTVFEEKNYNVTLMDGQKINCLREATRPLTSEQLNSQKEFGFKFQCGSFKCNPVMVNGKEYQATLIYESRPSKMIDPPTLFLTDKDGMGPRIGISTINSDKSTAPLYDNLIERLTPLSGDGRIYYTSILKNPSYLFKLQSYENLCSEAQSLTNVMDGRKKLLNDLANTELVQFISMMGDNYGSAFTDINSANKYGCFYDGVYFDEVAAKNLNKIKKDINPDKHVDQTISMEKASMLFKKAQDMKDIAWKYKEDGCYARAHLMARRFEAEGVRVDKAWLKGSLYIPEEKISWNFHVAPLVYVEDSNGKIQKMVIDPSLFDKPVTLEEWDKRISKTTIRGSSMTVFPFPENASDFERSALAISSSAPYMPGDSIELSETEKMTMANKTMAMYKELEPK